MAFVASDGDRAAQLSGGQDASAYATGAGLSVKPTHRSPPQPGGRRAIDADSLRKQPSPHEGRWSNRADAGQPFRIRNVADGPSPANGPSEARRSARADHGRLPIGFGRGSLQGAHSPGVGIMLPTATAKRPSALAMRGKSAG